MLGINPEACVIDVAHRVNQEYLLSGLVFICVDSMLVRRHVVDDMITKTDVVQCVIETRMDANVGVSHCFNPASEQQLACWRLYWHSDGEVDNMLGCGGPQSIISAIYATSALALKQLE